MPIRFFTEDIIFTFQQKTKHKEWLSNLLKEEGYRIGEVNYVFCSDEYLYRMNLDYLAHDTYTDIITFDQSEEVGEISGDIFISVERIRENAKQNLTTFHEELRRVLAHGLLHLIGYKDKTESEVALMRSKENQAIDKFQK
jgi:probable rRNA maturation factor